MSFEKTWRWFGPNDPYSLKEIKQTGTEGIVTALHHIPIGKVWPKEEILKRKNLIEADGLKWSVAESIPVHEDIKRRSGNYSEYINSYVQSIKNLADCGINTVCYNFMPVLDWSRTNLKIFYKDGSITSNFQYHVFAAFDVFILKRKNSETDYEPETLHKAEQYFKTLKAGEIKRLKDTILLGFPGSLETYTLEDFSKILETYKTINTETLKQNLFFFLKEIIPAAEESGVFMAIHPDDPPWPLLGLPRIVSTYDDLNSIIQAYDSKNNGITFCTGSLGVGFENDLAKMADHFSHRINYLHLRNVSRTSKKEFSEENHLEGDVDIYSVMKIMLTEQNKRKNNSEQNANIPMRADHGHLMIPDINQKGIYPGYSLFGRMRGLAELSGMEHAIKRELNF